MVSRPAASITPSRVVARHGSRRRSASSPSLRGIDHVAARRVGPRGPARASAFNLTTLPLWGQTRFIILALVVIGLAVAPPPFRAPFAVGLPACFAVVLLLVYFRAPYREGRGDSANRMTIQMLPLIVFYLAIKFIPALEGRPRGLARARPC